MTGETVKRAQIRSSNSLQLQFPYHGQNRGDLTLVKIGDQVEVMLSVAKGQILCSSGASCSIEVRFDEDQVQSWSVSASPDFDPTSVFLDHTSAFVMRAAYAKKIQVRLPMFQAGLQTLTFSPRSSLTFE